MTTNTSDIRDMLDNYACNADVLDAYITVLHAARAIDPTNAVGINLEANADHMQKIMGMGVDITKALRNELPALTDFVYDMEEVKRDMPADAPQATTTPDALVQELQARATNGMCSRCNLNARKQGEHCTICWSYLAHANALLSRGEITGEQYADVFDGKASVDLGAFPYADPAFDSWADDYQSRIYPCEECQRVNAEMLPVNDGPERLDCPNGCDCELCFEAWAERQEGKHEVQSRTWTPAPYSVINGQLIGHGLIETTKAS